MPSISAESSDGVRAAGESRLARTMSRPAAQRILLLGYLLYTAWFMRATTLIPHSIWARASLAAYCVALVVTFVPRWRHRAFVVAFVGSCLVPLVWMTFLDLGQPEVGVLVDGARSLLDRGTPYESSPNSLSEVRPYLPLLFVVGMPRALGLPGFVADPRIVSLMASLVFLAWMRRAVGRQTLAQEGLSWALLALPLFTLTLSVSAIDIPIVVALGVALVLLHRGRLAGAACATAAAMLMKPTALVLAAVVVVSLWRSGQRRGSVQFAAMVIVGCSAVLGPLLIRDRQGLWFNAFAFPAGLTHIASPAQGPFPGVFIAHHWAEGPIIAIALTAAALLGCLAYAWLRPAANATAIANRVAVALSLAVLLAPNSRAGYFVLPVALWAIGRALSARRAAPERIRAGRRRGRLR